MKCRWVMLIALLMAALPLRADTDQRDSVQAATDNARQTLRQQVEDLRVQRDLSVGELLKKIGGEDQLTDTINRAQQIGGPRWLNEQTCQVRLEIPGSTVISSLRQIVSERSKNSPIPAEAVAAKLKDLQTKTFCAIGTSASGTISGVRPLGDMWAGVPRDARRQAVAAARRDAVNRAMQNVRPVPLAQSKTVGDALDVKSVHDAVDSWLSSRPVTSLEFSPNLQVRLTLAAPADEMFDTFQSAAKAQREVPVPKTESAWDDVREEFVTKVRRVTGHAPATMPAAVNLVQLPATPPAWVHQQIESDGSSPAKSTRLKAARCAENDALTHLRTKVESLPLVGSTTVGEAQKRDKRVADAVDRALDDARTYKVVYDFDGSAKVKVNLDLENLWDEFQSIP